MTYSRNAFRSVLRQSRLAGITAVVGAFLAAPGFATADETLQPLGHSVIPGAPLVSFDISWVDQFFNTYWLADRNNKSVDVIPIGFFPTVSQLIPTGVHAFAGVPATPNCVPNAGPNDCVGPNGILVLNNTTNAVRELWVGDGPTNDPVCGGTPCSTVKVFTNAGGNNPTHTINTTGKARADELCFDPNHKLVMIANDVDQPPFVSLISTDTYQVLAKFSFTHATNGIEQCAWNPFDNAIYLNIPEIDGPGDDSSPGAVVRFSAGPGGSVTITEFDFAATTGIDQCAGPQGLAVDTVFTGWLMLGCNAPSTNGHQNTISVFNSAPNVTNQFFPDAGGADQVWYQPSTNHFSVTGGSKLPTEQFTLIDGISGPIDQTLFVGFIGSTTRRAHSVATWFGAAQPLAPFLELVILPIPAVGGTPAPFSSTFCGNDAAKGCVAYFGAVPDLDDEI